MTVMRSTPPFRADHVGSLLRPPQLLAARDDFAAGRIDAARLKAVEDEAITEAVAMQGEAGLQSATDGEFRRASWHMDFIYQLGGISKAPGNMAVRFRNATGNIEFTPAALHVGSRIRLEQHDLRAGLRLPQVRRHVGHAQAHDPVAEHGPLPRRPGHDRSVGLPGHGGVLE